MAPHPDETTRQELGATIIDAARRKDLAKVPWLLDLARTEDGLAGKLSLDALGSFGKSAAEAAVPLSELLMTLLARRWFGRGAKVAKILGRLGDRDHRVLGALECGRHAKGGVNRTRAESRKALRRLGQS